jgi:predicted transcriptional regulator
MEFTKEETAVAAALVKSSKSAKQLAEELDLGPGKVKKALARLVELGVARERDSRYSLIPKVRRGVMGKADEETRLSFKVHAIIEGQSENKEALVKANETLLKSLKNERLIKACNFVEEELIKEGKTYYVMFELDVYASQFEDLLYFVIHYGPSSVEFEEPAKFELNRHEAQGVLMDVATTLHGYMAVISKMKEDQNIVIK